jgi:hypothetical protein
MGSVMSRNRSKPHSFEDQLAAAAAKLEVKARELRPGKQRDELLRKIRQIDAAVHLNGWLKSPRLSTQSKLGRREDHMITDTFDRRTLANMEVALERACLLLPTDGEKHRARRVIAGKIIECANRGETTLSMLTEVGYAAAMQLTAYGHSVRKKEVVD